MIKYIAPVLQSHYWLLVQKYLPVRSCHMLMHEKNIPKLLVEGCARV